MEEIVVIVGPTGVGKTKLSVELAKKLDAEIINGDSVAIYKELNIGSAKPTILERDGIVHHLIDVRSVDEEYNVFEYQKDLRKLIADISRRGKRIIVVGGTGLYIKAGLFKYDFSVGGVNKTYDDLTNEEIRDKILGYTDKVDIHINNRKRLIRLLNKYENNEIITADKDKLLYPCCVIGLTTDRNLLYARINTRVDNMVKNGLVEEISSMKDKYLNSRILNSAIGYKEFYDYLYNDKDLKDVIEEIKLHSRRYAKRQYTFFRHQFDTKWFEVDFSDFSNTVEDVLNFINGQC